MILVSDVEDQDIGQTNVKMEHKDKVIVIIMAKYLENLIINLLNTIIVIIMVEVEVVQINKQLMMGKNVLTVSNRDIGQENAPNLVDKDKEEVVKVVNKQVIHIKGEKQIFES